MDTVPRNPWHASNEDAQDIDLILMDRDTAFEGRGSITRIQGIALEEGQTIYAQAGTKPIPTGAAHASNEQKMVQYTKFDVKDAERLLENASSFWRFANDEETPPRVRCIQLQATMEHALKALCIAQGERVEHKHTLNELWDDVQAGGEEIPATRDQDQLKKLTKYGGKLQDNAPGPEHDPQALLDRTLETGKDLLNHAKTRVPTLIEKTQKRLQAGAPRARRLVRGANAPTGGSLAPRTTIPPNPKKTRGKTTRGPSDSGR